MTLLHTLRTRVRLVELRLKAAPKKRDAAVLALVATAARQIEALASDLEAGAIDEGEFADGLREILLAHGADAAELAGLDDDTLIETLVDGRIEEYAAGFAADVSGGGLSDLALAARAANWAGIAWTAYQMARVALAPDGAEFWFEGPDDAATCDTCSERIKNSPYSADDYPGDPGDDTECMGNDRCEVKIIGPDGNEIDDGG